MRLSTRVTLSVMMFLQFFVWGAWYGQMSKYMLTTLHATGDQVGNAYAAFSLAMIIAPFFVGMIADRYFAAQKVLGVLNLLGAGLLYLITKNTNADNFPKSCLKVYPLIFIEYGMRDLKGELTK